MAKLKRKTTIERRMSVCYSDAEMAHRAVEHVCLNMMDDLRVVFAVSCRDRLGFGKKRLERVEQICNEYVAMWRKDAEAETIQALMIRSRDLGYNHNEIGQKIPTSYCWSVFNRCMPKKYRNYYPMARRTQYITGCPKIVILFIVCSLEYIRTEYGGFTLSQARDVLDNFVNKVQCLGMKNNEATIADYKLILKEECNYVYGSIPGSWHDIAFS